MNSGDEMRPKRKSLIGQLMDLLWAGSGRACGYHRHWITGTPMDRVDDGEMANDEGSLPHAELSEEERRQAVEEMRRKPQIR